MDFVQDLSTLKVNRYFIVGDILGDYNSFVNLLYHQRFGFQDVLITTGNFLEENSPLSANTIAFIKNNLNIYAVKGRNEMELLRAYSADPNSVPEWFRSYPKVEELVKFIEELPLIIKISKDIYIVNAGIDPTISIEEQRPEVFYSIGLEYDKDSKYYQFDNPEEKPWYEFSIKNGDIDICFGGAGIGKVEVPAGFSLGRTKENVIKALIVPSQGAPIIVEAGR